jgi:hypothetical protein
MRVIPVGLDRLPEFIDFAWEVNRGDPCWIPPLRASLERALSGADAFGRYAQQQMFACEQGGRFVARLVAIFNPHLRDSEGAVIGQLGYFEADNDARAVGELFEHAAAWLRARGARRVLGPINGGAHTPHRLLVAGFHTEPFLFEPRNPPYYPVLFEAHGFRPVHRWCTFEPSEEELGQLERTLDDFLSTRAGAFRIEYPEPRQTRELIARIQPALDRMWAGHTGYAHCDVEELLERNGGLFALMTPGDVRVVVDAEGRDVAFSFGYPDYADEVRQLAGDASGWGSWLGRASARRWVHHTLAVLPEVRDGQVALLLSVDRIRLQRSRGFTRQVGALTNQSWRIYRGYTPTRQYALYGRTI